MTKGAKGREIALDTLTEILEKGQYCHIALRRALSKYQYLEKSERAFISRLTEGTVEYLLQLDYVLNEYSRIKVNKMKPVIRTILRMSAYQILYMDRVPDSAACNEAVKLAAGRGFSGLKGFVNGVLRTVARNKESLSFPDDSVRYSMPEWLIELWRGQYGEETTAAMLSAFLQASRTAVRCNLDRAGRETIVESLRGQGVRVEGTEYSDALLYLEGYDYLEGLEAFSKGWIQVQDMSSVLAGEAAFLSSGDYVIDVCGAPGGKSLHLADRLKGGGMVEVRDISPQKTALIDENISRSGFSNMRSRVQDARLITPESVGKADVVIADLPCSGLGVIGRKPDIKYRMTPEKIDSLARLQREILSVVWQYVKPGGRLVYSTCTVDRKENEENADWFLSNYPFVPVDLRGRFPRLLESGSLEEGRIQLLPGIHPCDGFFISVFERK